MSFRLLVTQTSADSKDGRFTTTLVRFGTRIGADSALAKIEASSGKSGIYTTAIKLYVEESELTPQAEG